MQNQHHYTFELKKIKGRFTVVRIWHDGWFPINPVKGRDYRAVGSRNLIK